MKFQAMRRYDVVRSQQPLVSLHQSVLTESLVEVEEELSTAVQFLNYISRIQATTLLKEIYKSDSYKFLINPAHVDGDINPDEIISFTSVTSEDGE